MSAAKEWATVSAMRALGLDVGMKRIGVALTDAAAIAAHPLEVIERGGIDADVARVALLVKGHQVTDVVVGLPLEMSGKVGLRASRVKRFLKALTERLGTTIDVHEWDERFSTVAAERVLLEGDVSRKNRKKVIDKQAAAFILQGWLDAQPRQSSEEE